MRYKGWMLVMLFTLLTFTVVEIGVPYFYKIFFDALSSGQDRELVAKTLMSTLLMILGGNLIYWFLKRVSHVATTYYQVGSMRDLAEYCFNYLHHHSYRFFTDSFSGALVKKVNRFAAAFEGLTDRLYFDFAPLMLKIIFIFGVLLYIQPSIGLAMLIWTLLFIGLSYVLTRLKWKYDIRRAEMDSKVTAGLADSITNNANIKFFGAMKHEKRRYHGLIMEWWRRMVAEWHMGALIDATQGFLMLMLEFIVFYFAIRAWKAGQITIGDFVWMQTYLIQLFMGIWNFGRVIRDTYKFLADADEMGEILSMSHEVRNIEGAKDIHITRGRIEFNEVSFAYKDGGKEVIRNLNLKIKPSEKVALVGHSGSGKSTLTKLILRLFDIQKGQILVDGQDIQKVTQESLRSQISLVPQDPILFHRTLMDNIRYGRLEAGDEEVIYAAKLARCHEFIQRMPKQYETLVGERGVKLSGGERQRIAIARAILSNNQILILDEATSSLDSYSESIIQEALENLMKHKTTLVIAHRLSTISKMDRVIVMNEGQLTEDGTHADLIQKKSGLYKKLWDLQMGGYVD
jgi:ATP-binding cassette subfamily B protein